MNTPSIVEALDAVCTNYQCGHQRREHDEDGWCNGSILTILDTEAHCPCRQFQTQEPVS